MTNLAWKALAALLWLVPTTLAFQGVAPVAPGWARIEKERTVFQHQEEAPSSAAAASAEDDDVATTSELPPVLQHIADDRREFQMNLGRTMDTLRREYPDLLSRKPDFSIYDDNVKVIDPSGVQLEGLDKFQSSFNFFQTFLRFWFSMQHSKLQFRMVYDFTRASIRISWHVVLFPKSMVPLARPLHVDGISYYQLGRSSGKVEELRVEKLVINQRPVTPPYSILGLLQQDLFRVVGGGRKHEPSGVPVGAGII